MYHCLPSELEAQKGTHLIEMLRDLVCAGWEAKIQERERADARQEGASIGLIHPPDEGYHELRRSNPDEGVYQKLVLQDGHIVGAILLGAKARVPAVSRLIKEGTDVSLYGERLLDDDFDLAESFL